jgi:hypothetical protein
VPDAPRDGILYGRMDGGWWPALSATDGETNNLTVDATLDTQNLNVSGVADFGGQVNLDTLYVATNASVQGTLYVNNVQTTEETVTDNLIINNNVDINGPGGLQIAAGLHVIGNTILGGTVNIDNMPQADPHVAGQLWNNAGVVNVSGG